MNAHSAGSGDELKLSPSETMGHNAAMRVSGAATARDSSARTQRALASIVLGFELIVVFLMGMTVFGLAILEPPELGIWGGLSLCAVIVVALATMRVGLGQKPVKSAPKRGAMPIGSVGLLVGWVVHVLMLLAGVLLPLSLVVSVLFTALWVYCMVKGSSIDRQRAAWAAGTGTGTGTGTVDH